MQDTVIQFDNVSYHYPRAKKWALTKISVEIHKGEFIAVMGENGAGDRKSVV
jgi:ABC-type bacteriocin/lantibiotic exporter with double-glycine peptidase domain